MKENALILSESFVAGSLQEALFIGEGHNSSENERHYFLRHIRTKCENAFERKNMHVRCLGPNTLLVTIFSTRLVGF